MPRADLQLQSLLSTDRILAHPLIERERLHDSGCGAVDVMLLASTLLTSGVLLWTDDRKLHALALQLGGAFSPQ